MASNQRDIVENIVAKDSTKAGTDSAGRNFDKLKAKVDAAGKSGAGLGAKFKSGVAGIASVTDKVALAFAAFGGYAVKSASDAQQSLGATQAIFGKSADDIIGRSKEAATKYGLSANQYRDSANLIASLFKNQGVSQDKLAGQTDKMIAKASDLAAVFGGPTSDAVDALGSAFKGEFDPLEKYGITLNQTTINAEAMRLAHAKTQKAFDKLSPAQQKAYQQQATLNLINKQSADSTGQFAAQTNTSAEKLQIVKAKFENTAAAVGTKLLPVVDKLLDWGDSFIKWAGKHQIIVGAFAAFVAVIWLLNAALAANPIVLVLGLVAALAAGVIYAYTHFQTFRDIVNAVWNFVVTAFQTGVDLVLGALGFIIDGAAKAFGWIPGIGPKLKSAAKEFDKFKDGVNAALDKIKTNKTVTIKTIVTGNGAKLVERDSKGQSEFLVVGSGNRARAAGGSVLAGVPYLVGENGPEIVVPGASGTVVPNNQLGALGGAPVVHVYIGDRELTDIVRVEVDESNRATRRRVLAGAG